MTDYLTAVLTPADFSGYAYNRPSNDWELVLLNGSERAWITKSYLAELQTND